MAEPRRRRKCSDDNSEESGNELLVATPRDQASDEGDNSEYESIDEDELGDAEEGELIAIKDDENAQDGKPLDDDEDRKNPQYIPKKGTFYEHDDRTAAEDIDEEEEETEKAEAVDKKDPKKKMWKENDKWSHDKFELYDQAPKSKDELVSSYGYDIRNEEGPPRARRRRRYGRGPNKYTRNWEDFDAYGKPIGERPERGRGGGRGRGKPQNFNSEEEFPSLATNGKQYKGRNEMDHRTKSPRGNRGMARGVYQSSEEDDFHGSRGGRRGRGSYRGTSKPRYDDRSPPRRGHPRGKMEPRGRGRGQPYHQNSQYQDKELSDDVKNLHISSNRDEQYKAKRGDNKRVPPRMQETKNGKASSVDSAQSKTKRYSTQRQRPSQDSSYQHQQYYDQEQSKQGHPGRIFEGEPSLNSSYGVCVSPSSMAGDHFIPSTPAMMPPVTQSHLISAAMGGPITGTPLGPTAPVAPFIATENMINYVPPQALVGAHPQAFPVAPFQTFPSVSQQAPTEVYRNGVTYYYNENQQPRANALLPKRPKAAIPIRPPSEKELSLEKDMEPSSADDSEDIKIESNGNGSDFTANKHFETPEYTTEKGVLDEPDCSGGERMDAPECSAEKDVIGELSCTGDKNINAPECGSEKTVNQEPTYTGDKHIDSQECKTEKEMIQEANCIGDKHEDVPESTNEERLVADQCVEPLKNETCVNDPSSDLSKSVKDEILPQSESESVKVSEPVVSDTKTEAIVNS